MTRSSQPGTTSCAHCGADRGRQWSWATKWAGRRYPTRQSCAASAIWLAGSVSEPRRRPTRPGSWSPAALCASGDAMAKRAIMVLGCSSDAGKSFLAAALCRWLARRGERVAPFKAQNMSNNAGVCADGSEIGRAQYLQALAAGVPPEARMNPVLLKPEGDTRSQVVVMGRHDPTLTATPWLERRGRLWPAITAALDSLLGDFDRIVLEGAGSPAEPNLMRHDLVNLAVARRAGAACYLVADVDRGGSFAHLLGTWQTMDDADRALLFGFVLNKFSGA